MASNAQASLGAFTDSGWDLVAVDEESSPPVCPDCGAPAANGYWPVDQEGVDGVHGTGCDRCRTVVPYPVSDADRCSFRPLKEVVTAQFRDGEGREVRCASERDPIPRGNNAN